MVIQSFGLSITGSFEFLDKDSMKIDIDGILGLGGASVYDVSISSQTMILSARGYSLVLTRESPQIIESSQDVIESGEILTAEKTAPVIDESTKFDFTELEPTLFYFRDAGSENTGMKTIQFQIGYQNLSTTNWLNFSASIRSIKTAEGYVYDRGNILRVLWRQYDFTDGGVTKTTGYNGSLNHTDYFSLPPQFQETTYVTDWEVAENTSGYMAEISVVVNGEQHTYNLPVNSENVIPYKTQFVNNLTWSEYKNLVIQNTNVLGVNETAEFDFGSITPRKFFVEDDDWFLQIDLVNSSPAYQMKLWARENAYFILKSGVIYDLDQWNGNVWIGPGEMAEYMVKIGHECGTSRVDEKSCISYSPYYEPVVLFKNIESPRCVIIEGMNWENDEGGKYTDLHLVMCE